jgi:hypothetical protein
MTDPRLEDHAFGVELQMTELVEQIGDHLRAEPRQPVHGSAGS